MASHLATQLIIVSLIIYLCYLSAIVLVSFIPTETPNSPTDLLPTYRLYEEFLHKLRRHEAEDKIQTLKTCSILQDLLQNLKDLKICQTNDKILKILQFIEKDTQFNRIITHIENINFNDLEKLTFTSNEKIVNTLKSDISSINTSIFEFHTQTWNDYQEIIKLASYIEYARAILHSTRITRQNTIIPKDMHMALAGRNENRTAVFFTETSGTGIIKPRFVCGIESAAIAYPNADIYVLFTYLQTDLVILVNEALYNVIRRYKNVQILKVDIDTVFLDTPLEDFHKSGKLQESIYLAPHTSDILRTLVLWKYGGIYLDLDIVVVKNVTYKNFIVPESKVYNTYVANSAFALEKNSPVAQIMFSIINKSFNGLGYQDNGPEVITTAMYNYTGAWLVSEMNSSNLKGFVKLSHESLFPIDYYELDLYFNEKDAEEAMEKLGRVKDLWGMHIGNNMGQDSVVNVGSGSAYSLIAQKYCPRSYWSCHDIF